MPGFDGTGPRGMGPMTGGGRGFCSPSGLQARSGWWRYGGFRDATCRNPYYGMQPTGYGPLPFSQPITRKQEIDMLRGQAQALSEQLNNIESMIDDMKKQA